MLKSPQGWYLGSTRYCRGRTVAMSRLGSAVCQKLLPLSSLLSFKAFILKQSEWKKEKNNIFNDFLMLFDRYFVDMKTLKCGLNFSRILQSMLMFAQWRLLKSFGIKFSVEWLVEMLKKIRVRHCFLQIFLSLGLKEVCHYSISSL